MLSPSNILTVFVLLYYILTMMFPSKNPLVEESRIYPQVVMALMCIYCLWVSINKCRTILQEKIFQPFFVLMIFGGVYAFGVTDLSDLYKNILAYLKTFMGIFFMFTVYMHLHQDENMTKRNIFIIFCMQIIYVFYTLWMDKTMGYGVDLKNKVFDSNSGFLFECCVPMALIFPIKRLRLYLYMLLFVGCLYSGQRSAALAALACFPFCLGFLTQDVRKNDIIILSILLAVAIIPVMTTAVDNLIARHNLDLKGKSMGSGRSVFWSIVWRNFWSNDLINVLFGNGYNSVQQLLKRTYGIAIGAHNGWLDFMYVYGLVGLMVYVKSIFSLLTNNKRIGERVCEYKNILLIILILFVVKCTTSHGHWDITVMPLAMTIAIVLYDYKKKTVLENESETEITTQNDTIKE